MCVLSGTRWELVNVEKLIRRTSPPSFSQPHLSEPFRLKHVLSLLSPLPQHNSWCCALNLTLSFSVGDHVDAGSFVAHHLTSSSVSSDQSAVPLTHSLRRLSEALSEPLLDDLFLLSQSATRIPDACDSRNILAEWQHQRAPKRGTRPRALPCLVQLESIATATGLHM